MKSIKGMAYKVFSILCFSMVARTAFCQQGSVGMGQPIFTTELGTVRKLVDLLVEFCVRYSFQVLGGIIVLILGWAVARISSKFIGRFLEKHNVDVTVSKFLMGITKLVIIAFASLIALGNFGITIAPFIAGLSVIGFGTSFALQGPLSNYAAGATLIFTKPFKVGDIIEVANVMGEVVDITLPRTKVKTVDGTIIVIPNKHIIGEVIHNYSEFKKLDITVGISYSSKVDKAIEAVRGVVKRDKRVAEKPMPKVGISEFADSSINIYARLWCRQSDYWDLMFDINKGIHDEFDKNNITIPFPQRDVHIYNAKNT
jgi:small conductance mechanosensitive channel